MKRCAMVSDLVAGLLISIAAGGILLASLQMPYRRSFWDSPGLAPAVFAAAVLAMGLALAAPGVRPSRDAVTAPDATGGQQGARSWLRRGIAGIRRTGLRSTPAYTALVALYLLVGIPYAGFYPASVAFLAVTLLWVAGLSVPSGMMSALVVSGALYAVFNSFFKLPLR